MLKRRGLQKYREFAEGMHELTVVENIIRITEQVAAENKLHHVSRINLDVGAMQHLNEEIMEHGFSAAKEGTTLAAAELKLNWLPVKLRCNTCLHEYTPFEGMFFCPDCGDKDTSVIQGMELIIKSIEGE